MSGWRPALRIARRSLRTALGRSVLTAAMIAIPVAGVVVADGIVRTTTDRDVDVTRAMGTADLRVDIQGRTPFDVGRLLPEGSRAVPISPRYYEHSLRLMQGERMVRTRLDVVVLGDPLTAHLARLESGRLPEAADEVLLTRALAERLGVLDGDTVRAGTTITATGLPARLTVEQAGMTFTVTNGLTARVTGLAVEPSCLHCEGIVASPGSVLEGAMLDGSLTPAGYLVDLPPGTDAGAVARAWPVDRSTATTRESFVDTTPFGGYLTDAAASPVVVLAGLGMVVVVACAGAAFAVGARRQVRELGLVAADGGDGRHLRRIVLAQGLVVGVVGAASGLVLGAAVTVLGVPLWQDMTGQLMEDLRFGWPELAGLAVVGVIASVAAAAVPAFGVARMAPVDALAGRFRATAPNARFSVAGVLLAVAGVACVVASGLLGRDTPGYSSLPLVGTLAGALTAVTGLVLVLPGVVAAIGRCGARLPLSGRLAVRDAARHRHRTVAAVLAIMITVAGVVAAAFVLAAQRAARQPAMPEHTLVAALDPISKYRDVAGHDQLVKAMANMRSAVPGTTVREIGLATAGLTWPGSAPIFAVPPEKPSSPDCWNTGATPAIGTDLFDLHTGGKPPDAGVRSALADGKVVVFDPCVISPAGTVTFSVNLPAPVELPAYLAQGRPGGVSSDVNYYGALPNAFVSEETAARLGWLSYADTALVTYPASVTEAEMEAIRTAAEDAGVDTYVEYVADTANLPLLLAGLAGLIALLGSGVVVALSAADGRADLATLAALGAQPRRRRMIAGTQALVVSGLGALTGVVLGGAVGFAAVPVSGASGFAVPWEQVLLTGLAVPLLAAAVAVVATPGRLPMIQRRQS
jgi:putative ABC transport system permease protein